MTNRPQAQVQSGLWQNVPPAIFPAILGLFGLGLAWRSAVEVFALHGGISEMILAGTCLLYLFGLVAYLAKLVRRPRVIMQDLQVLPGRAGIGSMVLCLYLLSITILPQSEVIARMLLVATLGLHGVLVLLLIWQFITGPSEQRRVTPVWHLTYVGFIIGALAATGLELYLLALPIFLGTAIIAALVWSVSLEQIVREDVSPALRPVLVVHLSSVALLGLVAASLELEAVSMGSAGIAALLALWFLARVPWLTEAGFSTLWGTFTFPLAATANLWLTVGGVWKYPGGVALVAASLIIPIVAFRILRLWARGQLTAQADTATA